MLRQRKNRRRKKIFLRVGSSNGGSGGNLASGENPHKLCSVKVSYTYIWENKTIHTEVNKTSHLQ
jgi:hypothetical protein